MNSEISVSKGVFVYKNGIKAAPRGKRTKRKSITQSNVIQDLLWHKTYSELWKSVETKIQELNDEMFANVLSNLVSFVNLSYKNPVNEIPAGALLTGINMPDHEAQFESLSKEIRSQITPHIVCLKSQDCQTLRYMVENMILQFINGGNNYLDEDSEEDEKSNKIKKGACNFAMLQAWYEDIYQTQIATLGTPKKQKLKNNKKPLVVIIPDFEGFNEKVIQDFIQIASSYINILPIVLVFGVATSLAALHRTLPYHVSSKVNIKVFHSQQSTVYLNNVLENVFFSSDFPFHLGGRVFNLFTDIFLFYDLSVTGFIKNCKYAMIEHFSSGNATALCDFENTENILNEFTHDDFESVRHLLSFRKLVENETYENRIKLLTSDKYLKKELIKHIKVLKEYILNLHLFIKCLHAVVEDLPRTPLGKQIRELYATVTSKNLIKSNEFKECMQLLGFQSIPELCTKIQKICNIFKNNDNQSQNISKYVDDLQQFIVKINDLSTAEKTSLENENNENENIANNLTDRKKFREQLLERSKQSRPMNEYERHRAEFVEYITTLFEIHLQEPNNFYLHEIFFFNDISIQNHIIGTHRSAIHTALNDPHSYLQCSCCEIPNDSIILKEMPDVSIAYKLHLECGKMINLYDWLQAFLSIVDPAEDEDDSKRVVDPKLQARFTQAVAELEYLGFIKSSKRKADHVARLTWGG